MTNDATPSPRPATPDDPAAILFDLDGTIVDTVGTRVEAWLRTFAEVGIPADRAHLGRLIGSDGKRLAMEVAAIAGRPHRRAAGGGDRPARRPAVRGAQHRPAPAARHPGAHRGAGRRRHPVVDRHLAPRRAGRPVARHRWGSPPCPPLADGSQVKHAKPAPDLLLLAAEPLGIPARRCWYVGDATWDMLAARAASMTGIGITTGAADAMTLRRAGRPRRPPTLEACTRSWSSGGSSLPDPAPGSRPRRAGDRAPPRVRGVLAGASPHHRPGRRAGRDVPVLAQRHALHARLRSGRRSALDVVLALAAGRRCWCSARCCCCARSAAASRSKAAAPAGGSWAGWPSASARWWSRTSASTARSRRRACSSPWSCSTATRC